MLECVCVGEVTTAAAWLSLSCEPSALVAHGDRMYKEASRTAREVVFLSDPAREFVLKNENTLTVNYRTRDQKMSVVNKLTVND